VISSELCSQELIGSVSFSGFYITNFLYQRLVIQDLCRLSIFLNHFFTRQSSFAISFDMIVKKITTNAYKSLPY